jgi:tRNA threonylcarbamoyl adenosine modification protein (Sua5/YciO/YrdC/YwlC family)
LMGDTNMAQYFRIHSETPQLRLISQAVAILQAGGVIVYPTDTGYALGCRVGEKAALDRIRKIRTLDDTHLFTLICRDLSELATYALVSNPSYRLLRRFTPGPYTFILPATREVPRRLQHPKRHTIGLRVPQHPIVQALLNELQEALLSTTLIIPGAEAEMDSPEEIYAVLGKQVDAVLDGGYMSTSFTTVIDLLHLEPQVVRVGKGDPTPFMGAG